MFSGFTERIQRSWQLTKLSWTILMKDKELLWFPVLSGLVMLAIMIVFFVPFSVVVGLASGGRGSDSNQILGAVFLFGYYTIAYSVSMYFNVALIGAAMIRLDGGDPTMGDGLKIANQRIGKIIQFALISATVGTISQYLRERGGIIGSFIASFISMAWNFATFFVLPILIVKDIGPIDAIKESTNLFKKTWGEQVVATMGIGFVTGMISFAIMLVGVLLIALAISMQSVAFAVIVGIAMFVAFILVSVISGALNGIFRAVTYRWVESGILPDEMDVEMIRGAFQDKNKRKA
jgi:hypothetical protein